MTVVTTIRSTSSGRSPAVQGGADRLLPELDGHLDEGVVRRAEVVELGVRVERQREVPGWTPVARCSGSDRRGRSEGRRTTSAKASVICCCG